MIRNNKIKQRCVMFSALMALIVCCIGIHIFDSKSHHNQAIIHRPKVFTPDWGIAATLTDMAYPPYAVGDKKGYAFRVNTPALPKDVIDVGYRGQPNSELLAELKPNIILNTANYKENTAAYPSSIPVKFMSFNSRELGVDDIPKWADYTSNIHDIAEAINQPQIADPYIASSRQRIIDAGKNIREYLGDDRKILVSNFWDMRQMSVFNQNSIISLTSDMMGLELVSLGKSTKWGSTYIYPDKLYDLPDDTCLIVMEPILEFTKYDNLTSPIWQQSQFYGPDACLYRIAPVWTNNGIEAMVTFANNLEAAVTHPKANDIAYSNAIQ